MNPVRLLQNFSPSRWLIFKLGQGRARSMYKDIEKFLNPSESLLDIGAGTGNVDVILVEAGYEVVPLDIIDLTFTDKIKPVLYDGKHISFEDNQFDVALILTVLHHIEDPETVLLEARRVAKKIIVIEDIYYNTWHKYATYVMDSLLNLEFKGHPHSNRTDKQWKATFKKMRLKLPSEQSMKSFIVMRHKLYVLEK